MKQQFLFQSLFIGLLLAGLWGCSEETTPSVTGGSESQNNRLTVNVTDGGYIASAGEKPLTRVKETGYKTIFTTGDKIGLYAVKNNAIITGYDNLCLTLAADGKWTPPAGTELFHEGAAAYYAYYPYQADMTNKVTAIATDVTEFFKPLTDGWTPATDQSDYARYTAQDLMTGACTISDNPGNTRTLTAKLTHRMAMAVLNLPRTKYTLDTDVNYKWLSYPDGMTFSNFSPYRVVDDGSFRYLVKPAQTSLTLSGSYSNTASATKEWSTTANIAAGSYKNFNIDGGTCTEQTHILTMGDFFMKDGSLLALATDGTLTDKQKADCVGVVFQVGHNDGSNYSSTGIGQAKCHGYVVALRNAGNFIWRKNNPRVVIGCKYGWNGYYNQQTIEGYAARNNMQLSDFPAANACKTFSNPVAPAKTSGWFLPGTGELRGVFNSNKIVYNKIKKVDSTTADFSGEYSSSTEHGSDGNYMVTVPAYGYENNGSKSASYPVRPVLAF